MPIIEVNHVTKEFLLGQLQNLKQTAVNRLNRLMRRPVEQRASYKALEDVSFTVEPGEVLGIIGHNGAGKSTMLKILAGVTKPTHGTVEVKGRVSPLIELSAGLIGDLTGKENIYLNGSILGLKRIEIKRQFDSIVSFAELERFIDTPVKRYSSGMLMRLGFAIAISVHADILIVDEVLAVGDLAFQQKCVDRMESLMKREGRTVVIVGHNIRQLERICSRVILLDQGRISQDGNPRDVCGIFFKGAQERTFARHIPHTGEIPAQRGTGNICVTKVELLNDNEEPQDGTGLHEPLNVRISFECDKYLERPEIVVGLHTSDFVHVLSVSNALSDNWHSFEAGSHQITCRITDIPLKPFCYSLRLTFLDQYRHLLWSAENIVPVLITPGKFDITLLPPIGIASVPATWTFTSANIPCPSHN